MKVTISDVAKLAGVSTATVSHTINSTRYVSGETKEKVYKAIAELGYTPDASNLVRAEAKFDALYPGLYDLDISDSTISPINSSPP